MLLGYMWRQFSVQGHRRSVSHRFKEFELLDKELRQSFKPPCSLPAKVYQGKYVFGPAFASGCGVSAVSMKPPRACPHQRQD